MLAPISDRRYPMKCPLDAGTVVQSECSNTMGYIIDIFTSDVGIAQIHGPCGKARFGLAPEIHHDFNQILQIALPVKRFADVRRHDTEKKVEIIGDFSAWQFAAPRSRLNFDNLK